MSTPAEPAAHVAAALHLFGSEAHPTDVRFRVEIRDGDDWLPAGLPWGNRQEAMDALQARRSVAKTWAADGEAVCWRVVRETTTYTVEEPQP